MRSPRRSAKIRAGQVAIVQRKRRTMTLTAARGRSRADPASVLSVAAMDPSRSAAAGRAGRIARRRAGSDGNAVCRPANALDHQSFRQQPAAGDHGEHRPTPPARQREPPSATGDRTSAVKDNADQELSANSRSLDIGQHHRKCARAKIGRRSPGSGGQNCMLIHKPGTLMNSIASEAAVITRTRLRGSPSWPGTRLETGYVEAD